VCLSCLGERNRRPDPLRTHLCGSCSSCSVAAGTDGLRICRAARPERRALVGCWWDKACEFERAGREGLRPESRRCGASMGPCAQLPVLSRHSMHNKRCRAAWRLSRKYSRVLDLVPTSTTCTLACRSRLRSHCHADGNPFQDFRSNIFFKTRSKQPPYRIMMKFNVNCPMSTGTCVPVQCPDWLPALCILFFTRYHPRHWPLRLRHTCSSSKSERFVGPQALRDSWAHLALRRHRSAHLDSVSWRRSAQNLNFVWS
jgi:hypothetical protein